MKIPIPVDQIMDQLAGGKSIEKGLHVLAMGQPPVVPDGTGWEKAVFSESDQAEVDEILNAKPGLDLNLSSEEFAELSRRLANVPGVRSRGFALSEGPAARDGQPVLLGQGAGRIEVLLSTRILAGTSGLDAG